VDDVINSLSLSCHCSDCTNNYSVCVSGVLFYPFSVFLLLYSTLF